MTLVSIRWVSRLIRPATETRNAPCPLVAAALALYLATPSHAATVFTASLTGEQEVPPVDTPATGAATLTLNDARDALAFDLSVIGIALTDFQGGHIHRAPAGENGPIVVGFQGPINDLDGDTTITGGDAGFTLSAVWDGIEGEATTLGDEVDALLAGGLYFNIHSTTVPSGEVRGQIAPIPLPAAGVLMLAVFGGLALTRRMR